MVNEIPVNEKSSLIINTYNIGDWNWVSGGADSIGSNQPLTANVLSTTSLITEGIPSPFQVYTQAKDGGLSIPMSPLKDNSDVSFGILGRLDFSSTAIFPLVIGGEVTYFNFAGSDQFKTVNTLNTFQTKILQ